MIWQAPHYCGREARKICHQCANTAFSVSVTWVTFITRTLPPHLSTIHVSVQTQTSLMPGPRIFPPSCIRVVSPSCPGVLLGSLYQGLAQVCNPGTVVKQEKKINIEPLAGAQIDAELQLLAHNISSVPNGLFPRKGSTWDKRPTGVTQL